jgi:ABC-type sugar transport system substrate-binding protein
MAVEREKGLQRALADAPGVQLEQLVHSAWQRDKARRQLAGLLRRWPQTNLIWAANDPMALGALDALRDRGAAPGRDVLVMGLNLSAEALQEVHDGRMLASAGGHFLGGAWALVLLRDHHDGIDFAGEGLEQKFRMGMVDRANVDGYLARLGDQRWDRIDFRRFSRSFTPRLARHEFTLQKALGP